MVVKRILRVARRILLYTFLLTLPFNFQAFLAGAIFAKWHNDRVPIGLEKFTRELDSFSWMNQWSVPGAPTIWEYQDNAYPFFVPQLRTNTWQRSLGLTLPNQHRDIFEVDAPLDRMVAFDDAVRDVSCHRGLATEYWVYVSSLAMPSVFEWDRTFVSLLEYHEMHPLNGTAFAYVDCAASPFLCHIWQVQYPALVHFKIDEHGSVGDDIDSAAFESPLEDLRPIEVRIFDLGLQQEVSPLPPGVFPSMLEQMRALTMNEGAYTIEDEYAEIYRALHQFNELYYLPACNRQGSFLDYTSEFDNFMLKRIATPLGLEDIAETAAGIAFSASLIFGTLLYLVANPVADFWSSFFGQPTEMDHLAERLEEREAVAERGGIFGDMQLGFVDFMEDLIQSSAAASAQQPRVTTQKDDIKSLFAGLRANMSSILGGA